MNIKKFAENLISEIEVSDYKSYQLLIEERTWQMFREFLNAVAVMQKWQVEYFRTKDKQALIRSKASESEVKKMIENLKAQKVEFEKRKNEQ